ncbi:hypothetical protein VIGAN_09059300 [Vigna angularis var. angularis]|uniref:Uncharacterized protein n=1 Tax=Vigna angularis var. angularis TaxID=157739 RepID=A0A0S3SWT0_PHAAN|nr:hypothetical protein VIGAN_09059300 [Vigna angularis var. angularis]
MQIERVIDELTYIQYKILYIKLIGGGMLCILFLVLISLEIDIIYLYIGLILPPMLYIVVMRGNIYRILLIRKYL